MSRLNGSALAALVLAAGIGDSNYALGASRAGAWGGRASPEERERRRQLKLARASLLTAKAEAKRKRKQEKRLSAGGPLGGTAT